MSIFQHALRSPAPIRYMPDASISGDAIVGFPGETEEQYLATEALVREVGFDRVNTAAYSPRPNTPAAEWENQVRILIGKRCGTSCCGTSTPARLARRGMHFHMGLCDVGSNDAAL